MVALTQVTLTCDVCGDAKRVQTRKLGLDGKAYEVDLCPKDSKGLSQATAGYVSKARRCATTPGPRHSRPNPRPRASDPGTADRTRGSGKTDRGEGSIPGSPRAKARTGQAEQRRPGKAPKRTASVTGAPQEKGVFVYGIFPADIEVAGGKRGVGEDPGLMRAVHAGDLAALVSEVRLSGRLGSPADVRFHRKTLDASARGVPVLALPFGTVLPSDEAVAQELLVAHRDEFTRALHELEGRVQFVIQGRYLGGANAAGREEDTRALANAMAGQCVASTVRKAAHEQDAVHVAFLVDIDQQREVERVIEDLAREWDGRIELQVVGPMAAYDFTPAVEVERWHLERRA